MVFGFRTKATPEQLKAQADHKQYVKRYGQKYLQANFEEGEEVYAPLWDKIYTLLDLEDDWLAVVEEECEEGLLFFHPWEVKKL